MAISLLEETKFDGTTKMAVATSGRLTGPSLRSRVAPVASVASRIQNLWRLLRTSTKARKMKVRVM